MGTKLEGGEVRKLKCRECIYQRDCKEATRNYNRQTAETLKEVMSEYDKARERWIKEYGNEGGFDQWFTKQIGESITP